MKKRTFPIALSIQTGAILILLCLINTNVSHAQVVGQLFSVYPYSLQNLSANQLSRYNTIQAGAYNVSVDFINIASFQSFQQNGKLYLQMPGKDCVAAFRAKHVESYDNGDFFWYGELQREGEPTGEVCSCNDGSIYLISNNGELYGEIMVDEDSWSVHDLTEGRYALAKQDYSNYDLTCGNTVNSPLFVEEHVAVESRNGGNCPVRVLALYTSSALDAFPDIRNRINMAINQTNQALRNSKVIESELTITLRETLEFDFTESNSLEDDITTLVADDNLKTLRDQYNADIVVVFTNSNDPEYNGISGSIGPSESDAIAIVSKVGETPYTTAHEIGHLFGCRHQFGRDDSDEVIEHGYEFRTGSWPCRKYRKTILAIPNKNRILHYSNPEVKYEGKSTGDSQVANNAQKLRATACEVADFRDDDPVNSFYAFITGVLYGCPCDMTVLHANGYGGIPGPYTFEWYISADGFSWGAPVSNAAHYLVELPCTVGDGVYVRLKGTSSDGQVYNTFRFVEARETWIGQEGPCLRATHQASESAPVLEIFPNPSSDEITVSFECSAQGGVSIVISDASGRLVQQHALESGAGHQQVNLSVGRLKPGIYFIQAMGADFLSARKFVKL
jgi:hypothetical protein